MAGLHERSYVLLAEYLAETARAQYCELVLKRGDDVLRPHFFGNVQIGGPGEIGNLVVAQPVVNEIDTGKSDNEDKQFEQGLHYRRRNMVSPSRGTLSAWSLLKRRSEASLMPKRWEMSRRVSPLPEAMYFSSPLAPRAFLRWR